MKTYSLQTAGRPDASPPWTAEHKQLLRCAMGKDLSEREFELFVFMCKKSGLDPFSRQIHAVKRWNENKRRTELTFQTGIDGYRLTAERSGDYAGSDKPVFVYKRRKSTESPTKLVKKLSPTTLQSAAVTVYRLVQGQRVPFTATAFWDEYVQFDPDGSPSPFWQRMPRGQLAKCAEALALRKAFPGHLSGIYTHEEMQQAENVPGSSGAGRSSYQANAATKNKRQFCWFCRKWHVQYGEKVIKADISDPSVKNPVWGSLSCWESLRAKSAPTSNQQSRKVLLTRDQIADKIRILERRLTAAQVITDKELFIKRQEFCGKKICDHATLPGLKNYLIHLQQQGNHNMPSEGKQLS